MTSATSVFLRDGRKRLTEHLPELPGLSRLSKGEVQLDCEMLEAAYPYSLRATHAKSATLAAAGASHPAAHGHIHTALVGSTRKYRG
jgi:hypothetical protein